MTEPQTPGPLDAAPAPEAPVVPEVFEPPASAEAARAPEGTPGLATPPASEAPSGAWVAPPPGRPRRGVLLLVGCGALALALVPVVVVALIFLGGQIQEILSGTVQFGTSADGCSVKGEASSFPVDTAVAYVARLERKVSAGETVTITLSFAGSKADSADQTFESAADCLTGTLPASLLGPGHYRLDFTAGSEALATGEFDLAP